MSVMRVCAGTRGKPCYKLTLKRRCELCSRTYELQRGSRRTRGAYDSEWRRVAARAIREHPWCSIPGCRNTDLTGDHITPRALGGLNVTSNVQVLCRGHNSSKGVAQNKGAG